MTSAMAIGFNDLVPVGGSPSIGNVAEFDEPRGLGVIEYGPGRHLPFHCTAITDGSRQIAPGTVVAFNVGAGRLGRLEARSVRPLPGVVPPGSSLSHVHEDRSQLGSAPSGVVASPGPVDAPPEPAVVEPEPVVVASAPAAVEPEPAVAGLQWLAAPEVMEPIPGSEPQATAAGLESEAVERVDDTGQGELAFPPEDPEDLVPLIRAAEAEYANDEEAKYASDEAEFAAELASHRAPFDFESDGVAPAPQSDDSGGPVSGGAASDAESDGGAAGGAAVGVIPSAASSEGEEWGRPSPPADSTPPMGTASVAPGVTVAPPLRSPEASSWLDQPEPASSGRSGDDESPHPDFWSPIAKSSSGPPPTWRTPVTRRSPSPSDGD
jgi:cold shock CspA family protein